MRSAYERQGLHDETLSTGCGIRIVSPVSVATAADDAVVDARFAVRRTIFALMGMARASQTKLAGHIGISQPQLSQRLNGKVPFSEDELAKIAGVFGIDVPDLYDTEQAIRKARTMSLWITPVIHSLDGQLELHFAESPFLVAV